MAFGAQSLFISSFIVLITHVQQRTALKYSSMQCVSIPETHLVFTFETTANCSLILL